MGQVIQKAVWKPSSVDEFPIESDNLEETGHTNATIIRTDQL